VSPASPVGAVGTRDRLLDATERCLSRSGIRRTTMTEIAHEAGVSRAWLYRHFPDKASLVTATLARTDDQFWTEAHARVSAASGIAAQIATAVVFAREQRPSALGLRLKAEEPAEFAAMIGTGLVEMMPGMARFWHGYLEAAQAAGELRPDLDIARAAEWVMRIVLSLVTVPGGAVDTTDRAATGRFLDDMLVAGLGAR
jgi:AcrR family transcriptional regulator